MSNEPNGFAKYLVIFVDILGSQNRVDFQETYKINKIFHEELERNKQNDMMHTVYFRKIYTFSDCAYIFYGFKDGISDERKDEGELFKVALCNCEPIFLRFIKERILFRGGISYGDAYVDPSKSMFFGDAVNKAYQEQVNALNTLLENTLNKQEKKTFPKTLLWNLFFCLLSAILGYILGKLL